LTKKLNEQTNIQYLQIINKIEIHFLKHFWDTENNYLYDVLDNKLKPDRSFRPNQLYAASLPYPLIFGKEKENLFAELRSKLWTPYGLRTLSPDHVDFKPNYTGDQWSRDCAYHQGSVWPFLLSEYYKVYFDIYGTKAEIIADVEQQLAPLVDHFYKQNDIYGISEIFDGLHPFEGKGTANQAWSVGAMLQIVKHLQYLKSIESKQKPMKSAVIH
jgi:glycogen debranching enzyme